MDEPLSLDEHRLRDQEPDLRLDVTQVGQDLAGECVTLERGEYYRR